MSQPPINPLKNMKIDYWYKALTVVGAALFVFNGTSFFDRYPVVPLGFLSSGIFFIGLGEWINHPLKVRFIGPESGLADITVLRAHSVSSSIYLVVA